MSKLSELLKKIPGVHGLQAAQIAAAFLVDMVEHHEANTPIENEAVHSMCRVLRQDVLPVVEAGTMEKMPWLAPVVTVAQAVQAAGQAMPADAPDVAPPAGAQASGAALPDGRYAGRQVEELLNPPEPSQQPAPPVQPGEEKK